MASFSVALHLCNLHAEAFPVSKTGVYNRLEDYQAVQSQNDTLDVFIPFGILPFGIGVDTADLILTHALELFSARGYDAVGVQELVLAAGVTKPTLYYHFGNKEGVLAALITRDGQRLLERLEAATHYQQDLTLNLLAIVETYLAFTGSQTSFYRLLSACSVAPPESRSYRLARPLEDQQHRLVKALFEAASRDHGNMRGRARRYTISFLGLISAYSRLVLAGEVIPGDTLKHDIVKQFSYGIYS